MTPAEQEKCPKCGTPKQSRFLDQFSCGTLADGSCQSDLCRFTALERKLAAAEAERDRLRAEIEEAAKQVDSRAVKIQREPTFSHGARALQQAQVNILQQMSSRLRSILAPAAEEKKDG